MRVPIKIMNTLFRWIGRGPDKEDVTQNTPCYSLSNCSKKKSLSFSSCRLGAGCLYEKWSLGIYKGGKSGGSGELGGAARLPVGGGAVKK